MIRYLCMAIQHESQVGVIPNWISGLTTFPLTLAWLVGLAAGRSPPP